MTFIGQLTLRVLILLQECLLYKKAMMLSPIWHQNHGLLSVRHPWLVSPESSCRTPWHQERMTQEEDAKYTGPGQDLFPKEHFQWTTFSNQTSSITYRFPSPDIILIALSHQSPIEISEPPQYISRNVMADTHRGILLQPHLSPSCLPQRKLNLYALPTTMDRTPEIVNPKEPLFL